MKLVSAGDPVSIEELRSLAAGRFGDLVKAVVDLSRGVMLVDADMHADQETALLESGSSQKNLWGINLYPDLPPVEWIEFDSMVNLRPSSGNLSRGVDDAQTRRRIVELVERLVVR